MTRRWLLALGLLVVVLLLVVGAVYVVTRPAEQPRLGERPPAGVTPGAGTTPTSAGPPPSAQSTWYAVYFTDPKYPTDARNYRGGLDERLVELMDQAQRTLDVADYDFDLLNVAQAMARAKQRGVRVRLVTDSDTIENTKDEKIQAALGAVRGAEIPIVEDNKASIMHNKFTVVDGEWVSTGSWNYTEGDTYRLNNWMGVFRSKLLAENYAAEFEQMFSGKFGGAKREVLPHPVITIDDARIRTCFSPEGDCAKLIVETIQQNTQRSLYFLAFSFTHDGIGDAIVAKQKSGVTVSGVFETTGSQTAFSEFTKMKRAGLDVYTDGNPYVMHHKVIVIDERIVVAGSFNFSSNADESNDENLLIIEDPNLARAFKAEFDRVLAQAKNPPAREKP